MPGGGFADDGNRIAVGVVIRVEVAACKQRNAHGLEVAGGDRTELDNLLKLRAVCRGAAFIEAAIERQSVDRSNPFDTGRVIEIVKHVVDELHGLPRAGVAIALERDLKDRELLWLNAGGKRLQPDE